MIEHSDPRFRLRGGDDCLVASCRARTPTAATRPVSGMPLNPIATAIRRAPSRDIAASYSVAWSLLHDCRRRPLLMDNVHASRICIDMGQPKRCPAVGTSGTILSTLWRIVTCLAAKVRAPGGPGCYWLSALHHAHRSAWDGDAATASIISRPSASRKEQTLLNIVRLRAAMHQPSSMCPRSSADTHSRGRSRPVGSSAPASRTPFHQAWGR